jgi:uncharacterized protein (TIGR02271 family)
MDIDRNTLNITGGTDVFGADGDKVGSVSGVEGDYLVVSKGFFFPTDYYIPTSAINTADAEGVYLNVTKDEALNQGWDTIPTTTSTSTVEGGPAYTDQGFTNRVRTDAYAPGTAHDATTRGDESLVDKVKDAFTGDDPAYAGERRTTDADTTRVELAEEELTAHTRPVDRGQVQVDKVVTEEEQTIDVPVTEERVTVRRRPATAADGDQVGFADDTITVPVLGEDVVVDKQAQVREVVEIGKEQVTDTRRVTDTVRREEAQVRDEAGKVVEDTVDRGTRSHR